MILQELCKLYERLERDPETGIAKPGYAPQKVVFKLILNQDGTVFDVIDMREKSNRKMVAKNMLLPQGAKRTGKKQEPMPFWDKSEYLLGWSVKDKSNEKNLARFQAWKDGHLKNLKEINEPELDFLKAFLESWKPEEITGKFKKALKDYGDGFGVTSRGVKQHLPNATVTFDKFHVIAHASHGLTTGRATTRPQTLRGEKKLLHEYQSVISYLASSNQDEDNVGQCLLTGEFNTSLARLHPAIKGFESQQNIVAFNKSAFESYGNKDAQAMNAPTSKIAAFKYTTALNWLLQKRKINIGETIVVYWSSKPLPEEDIFSYMLQGDELRDSFEDDGRRKELQYHLEQARQGRTSSLSEGSDFFLLGLTDQVKARLGIRFWIQDSPKNVYGHIFKHQNRLKIAGGKHNYLKISVSQILDETIRKKKSDKKNLPSPLLGGALLRSVLSGNRYPESLLSALVRRTHVVEKSNEGKIIDNIPYARAAAIKAVLILNYKQEIDMSLNPDHPKPAYQLGRLFAALEHNQENAFPGRNATVKDRFFGAASATPGAVFPLLIRLGQHHIAKLPGGLKVYAEKQVQEIMGRIESFPGHLDLVAQGLFALGYYHQRQDFFKSKNEEEAQPNQN